MELQKIKNKSLAYKEKEAIGIIRKYAPKGEIYYLAYSAGKDSDVLLHLARRSGVNFQGIHNFTTIAHREQLKHLGKQIGIKTIYPKENFYKLIEKKGLPTRVRRWCCDYLKHSYGKGKIIMTGVRKSESVQRNKRAKEYIEYGAKSLKKRIRSVLPLLNFTEKDIWNYIEKYKIETCSLYKIGYKRVGCVGCPLAGHRQRLMDFEHSPGIKKAIENSFDKYMNNPGIKGSSVVKNTFKNGEDGVKWWLSNLNIKEWEFNKSVKVKLFEEEL